MYSDTILTWLDMKDKRPYTATIKELYQELAHKEIRLKDGSYLIRLDDDKDICTTLTKFQDLTGWTDGIMLRKYVKEHWIAITANDRSIIVSDNEFIPVYFPDHAVTGFHGEVKYPYILKHAGKVTKDDHIRIICNNESIFIKPEVSDTTAVLWSYEVIAVSRFMNADIFHIYANDMITVDEAKTWEDSEDDRIIISNKCFK